MPAMSTLQSLRQARATLRWVLLGFALSLGVALASPLVQPPQLQWLCSAAGSVVLADTSQDRDLDDQRLAEALHCALCLPVGAPPPSPAVLALAPAHGAAPAQPKAVRPSWRLSEPTSARDPPAVG